MGNLNGGGIMMKKITACLFFLMCFFSVSVYSQSASNILFSLQRHTYVEGEKSISIGLRNGETEPYLVQSGMAMLDLSSGVNQLDNENEKIPFIITPPLHKIKPDTYYDWRVIFSGDENTLPKDRESVFLAKFLFIPSTQKTDIDKADMSVLRSFVFKIYYRPKTLASLKLEDIKDEVSFYYRGNTLLVKNNSPVFITFDKLSVNSKDIDNNELFKPVPPLSEQTFKLPYTLTGDNTIEWQLLNEFAFPLDKHITKATAL